MPSTTDSTDLYDPWGIAFKESSDLLPPSRSVAGAPITGILLEDNFNGVNGTALTAHALDVGPAGWTAVVGTFFLQTNTAQPNSDADGDQTIVPGVQPNGFLFCTVYCHYPSAGNAERPGILFRWSDATHYWLVNCEFDSNTVTLYKKNGAGPATVIDQQPCAFASDVAEDVRVYLSGNNIHVVVGSVVFLSTVDSFNNTAANYGIRLEKVGIPGGKCTWDTFVFMS